MVAVTPVISIDGPSGAGKGTLCKAIAEALNWHFLDSGAIYRVLTLVALRRQIDITSEENLADFASHLDVYFIYKNSNLKVIFEGEDVSRDISAQEIANIASHIAILPLVRKALLRLFLTFRKEPGLIADGRDMGTIVFPDASIKIFLDASPEKRFQRRMLQLQEKGFNIDSSYILSEIKERDYRDRNRVVAPLIPAKDALMLDSTSLTIDQLIGKAVQYIRQKLPMVKSQFN